MSFIVVPGSERGVSVVSKTRETLVPIYILIIIIVYEWDIYGVVFVKTDEQMAARNNARVVR